MSRPLAVAPFAVVAFFLAACAPPAPKAAAPAPRATPPPTAAVAAAPDAIATPSPAAAVAVAVPVAPTPAPDTFATAVRPILVARCAPCHEPGGKMYAKLPFDDPKVLRDHVPGVTKRLKGDDLATFQAWLGKPSS